MQLKAVWYRVRVSESFRRTTIQKYTEYPLPTHPPSPHTHTLPSLSLPSVLLHSFLHPKVIRVFCDYSFLLFTGNNEMYDYKVYRDNLTYTEADHSCQGQGRRLAQIDNVSKLNYLQSKSSRYKGEKFWMGLKVE